MSDAQEDETLSGSEPVRLDPRILFSAEACLSFSDAFPELQGATQDVSLSGAFFHMGVQPDPRLHGLRAVIHLSVKKEDGATACIAYPCRIVRVTPKGLGLCFEDS